MEDRTKGAWIINHTKKMSEVTNAQEFEDIELAGKCGIYLSNLAASEEQSDLSSEKIDAIAKVSGIKKTEIDTIKRRLHDAKLIDIAANGSISVLGITTATVLNHTTDIFLSDNPSSYQQAALELSDSVSDLPKGEKELTEYISDSYSLSKDQTSQLFAQSVEIGFIDNESLDDRSKFYFNGNLFRRDAANKANAVVSSLNIDDRAKIINFDEVLTKNGCASFEKAKSILGDVLLSKLQSIGMYDFNEVSNPKEVKVIVTKPSAFSKYGNPFEEDALDLAKTFVSALYYGMNFSQSSRGKINQLGALMRKLVSGREVGPATAIGQDYNLLEYKRVISIRKDPLSTKYYMKLLKKDIGELAMQVLQFGDTVEQTVVNTNLGNVSSYKGPEELRGTSRKRQNAQSKASVAQILRTFRS